ncbi:hypothetical protein BaRGS_00006403 [Batillaria attramentaria]|uniref:Uncharacterized protein n=1 Tax=Batillaria attramentaria TaxID=370345 RepID=A0ABD0LSC9_9CAEN
MDAKRLITLLKHLAMSRRDVLGRCGQLPIVLPVNAARQLIKQLLMPLQCIETKSVGIIVVLHLNISVSSFHRTSLGTHRPIRSVDSFSARGRQEDEKSRELSLSVCGLSNGDLGPATVVCRTTYTPRLALGSFESVLSPLAWV